MEEIWVKIQDFPNYSISSEGRVRNDHRKTIVRTSLTQQGGVKVSIGNQYERRTLSVKLLVAETFVDGYSDRFDTPINLDGDLSNNSASNLVWRPRSFAWRYKRQFINLPEDVYYGPIVDRDTGIVFENILEAAKTYGLIFSDVHRSLVNKVPAWPTWKIFDWLVDIEKG